MTLASPPPLLRISRNSPVFRAERYEFVFVHVMLGYFKGYLQLSIWCKVFGVSAWVELVTLVRTSQKTRCWQTSGRRGMCGGRAVLIRVWVGVLVLMNVTADARSNHVGLLPDDYRQRLQEFHEARAATTRNDYTHKYEVTVTYGGHAQSFSL